MNTTARLILFWHHSCRRLSAPTPSDIQVIHLEKRYESQGRKQTSESGQNPPWGSHKRASPLGFAMRLPDPPTLVQHMEAYPSFEDFCSATDTYFCTGKTSSLTLVDLSDLSKVGKATPAPRIRPYVRGMMAQLAGRCGHHRGSSCRAWAPPPPMRAPRPARRCTAKSNLSSAHGALRVFRSRLPPQCCEGV